MYVQRMQQNGRVAQWLAYQTVDLVVAGSNPVSVAIKTDTATGTNVSSSGFLSTETGNQQEVTESENGESGTSSEYGYCAFSCTLSAGRTWRK